MVSSPRTWKPVTRLPSCATAKMENHSSSPVTPEHSSLPRSYTEAIAFTCLYVPLAIVIVTGNSLVIVAFRRNRRPRPVLNLLLSSLAVSDLMVGAVSVPIWIYTLVCPFLESCSLSWVVLTRFYQPFDIFSAHASIANLTLISLERFFAVAWPIRHRNCPAKFYHVLVSAAWLYAGAISVSYSFMSTLDLGELRTLLVFMAGFVVPLVTITIMHACIYRSVRSLRFRRNNDLAVELRRNLKTERKTARTVLIVTVLFVVAWLPFFVISMLFTFCRSCLPLAGRLTRAVDFAKLLQYSNSAVNPFVYACRNGDVRQSVLRLLLAPFPGVNSGRNGRNAAAHARQPRVERGTRRVHRVESDTRSSRLIELKELSRHAEEVTSDSLWNRNIRRMVASLF